MGAAEVTVNKGVSQGSCLSPILFNLYTAELHSLSNDQDSILFQYADDFFLVCYDKVFSLTEEKLEQKVNRFMKMCNTNNLIFNPDKSAKIHLNLRRKPLSVFLTISKSNQTNTRMFVQILSGCRYGVHLSKSLLFYKAYLRTRYEYACSSACSNISKSE